MKQITIEENNKLIAEFMGWKQHPKFDNCFINKDKSRVLPFWCDYNMEIPLGELYYNNSWDWLMTVVEKVNELGYHTMIIGAAFHKNQWSSIYKVVKKEERSSIVTETGFSLIENTYKAVVGFIKWYNEK